MTEQILRVAAFPLLGRLPGSILEEKELHNIGRFALWQHGAGQPERFQVLIARKAMIDEIRRSRWTGRRGGRRIYNGARGGSKEKDGGEFHMPRIDDLEVPEGSTDCQAASMVAVRQCIDKMHSLPEREREILGCLASGMDQQEVAQRIGLSPQRVGQLIAELRQWVESDLI